MDRGKKSHLKPRGCVANAYHLDQRGYASRHSFHLALAPDGSSIKWLVGSRWSVTSLINSSFFLTDAGVITLFSGASLSPKETLATSPGSRSPFMTHSPPPQTRSLFGENVGGTGSPVMGKGYTRSNLFVVNPSLTPRESPSVYQGSQADIKGFTILGDASTVRDLGAGEGEESYMRKGPGYRGSSGVFPSGLQGVTAPQIRLNVPVKSIETSKPTPSPQQKRSLFNWSKQAAPPTVRSLGISGPVMASENQDSSSQPFAKIQTIDLATAAANERERRGEYQ